MIQVDHLSVLMFTLRGLFHSRPVPKHMGQHSADVSGTRPTYASNMHASIVRYV